MKKVKIRGAFRLYSEWPIILSLWLIVPIILVAFMAPQAFFLVLAGWIVYVIIAMLILFYSKGALRRDIISFATQYGQVQKGLLKGLAIPYALLDESGRFVWSNAGFAAIIHKDRFYSKSITSFFPEITKDKFPVT